MSTRREKILGWIRNRLECAAAKFGEWECSTRRARLRRIPISPPRPKTEQVMYGGPIDGETIRVDDEAERVNVPQMRSVLVRCMDDGDGLSLEFRDHIYLRRGKRFEYIGVEEST